MISMMRCQTMCVCGGVIDITHQLAELLEHAQAVAPDRGRPHLRSAGQQPTSLRRRGWRERQRAET
eukprot:COSAG01_NODE_5550_length_4190_cov_48.559276_7_plen_66_part_00